jgi:hypothetical protein
MLCWLWAKRANVTLIERPVRAATLLSSIKSALRARRRQYDVRDHLEEQALPEKLSFKVKSGCASRWMRHSSAHGKLDLASGRLECTPRCKADSDCLPMRKCSSSRCLQPFI